MEVTVAMAVFSVAITIAMTSFFNITNVQKRAASVRAANNSINFTMETMSREIRTGRNYNLINPSEISFISAFGDSAITYRLNGTRIEMSKDGGPFLAITPPETEISELKFIVSGESAGDSLQPMVTIIIRASSGTAETAKSYLNLQTTVTQRKIDS